MIYKKTRISRLANLVGYFNFLLNAPYGVFLATGYAYVRCREVFNRKIALLLIPLLLVFSLLLILFLVVTGPFAVLFGYTVRDQNKDSIPNA